MVSLPTVLVIDDDLCIRKMLCEILNLDGYPTITAEDGQEGLEILWKTEKPLVALLGYMMPNMLGTETLRYLAEDPVRARRHAIVLVSGHWNFPEMAAEVFPYALLPFIKKPFTAKQLLRAVEQATKRLYREGLNRV